MTHVVCPGSFDPPTNGHLDVIGRAAGLFDRVTAAVLINPDKRGLFELPERLDLLREVVAPWPNVTVDSFTGLLVDYCRSRGITGIVKGLRAVSDFEYEVQMAQMNSRLTGGEVSTVFLPTGPEYAFLSSSLIKQVATLGADIAGMVPDPVLRALRHRLTH